MSERLEFDFGTRSGRVSRTTPDEPMRILVLGDFSGREEGGAGAALADRSPVVVDAEEFDRVMLRIAPSLQLAAGPGATPVTRSGFSRLADFHPDRLFSELPAFRDLREARQKLLDPATFEQAAAELRLDLPAEERPADPSGADAPEEPTGAMFERLLGKAPGASDARPPGEAAAVIRDIVAPHLTPGAHPQQQTLVELLDHGIADRMRCVLHDSRFQALEAGWRGLHWLVSNLETGGALTLHLLDVTKTELLDDLRTAGGDLAATSLHRLLVERGAGSAGGASWSLIVGNYTFDASAADIGMLVSLGAIAAQAGGPFLAGACPSILGCESMIDETSPADWTPDEEADARWSVLRNSPVAPSVGLALPRFLLRLPYGAETDEIDSFALEELTAEGPHDGYLWGNPAFACAWLIAQAYLARGWSMEPGDLTAVEDLPAHNWRDGSEWKMKPCAEAYLPDSVAEAILGRGIMPLISRRDRGAVQLLRFQSVAEPAEGLRGPWG